GSTTIAPAPGDEDETVPRRRRIGALVEGRSVHDGLLRAADEFRRVRLRPGRLGSDGFHADERADDDCLLYVRSATDVGPGRTEGAWTRMRSRTSRAPAQTFGMP